MKEIELAKIIEQMVPQLYLLDHPIRPNWGTLLDLIINGRKFYYITYNTGRKGGPIRDLFEFIEENSRCFCELDLNSGELERKCVEREIATKWLEIKTSISQREWGKILDHIGKMQNRTYENLPIVKNIIIDPEATGYLYFSEASEMKLIDVMGGSNYVYFIADKEFRIADYKEVSWNEISDKPDYSSVPNFLRPFTSVMKAGQVGIALTRTGDVIVYNEEPFNHDQMIISIRKGDITVYQGNMVKNLFRDVLKAAYNVACNLFDICWDISYRRHGALIVLALDDDYERHIVNRESILGHSEAMGIRKHLAAAIERISLLNRGQIAGRNTFLELSSVDGAVILEPQTGQVKAFGSIIETAASVHGISGARTTAAESAVSYENMQPIKISSDGDITLYRKITDLDTGEEITLKYKFY